MQRFPNPLRRRAGAPSRRRRRVFRPQRQITGGFPSGKTFRRNPTTVSLGTGFPKKTMIRHKYCDTIGITSTTGAPQHYLFSCNGLFDPDITATGHQPMYFDQMGALYNHYTVIGAKMTITAIPQATNEDPFRIAIHIEDDTSVVPTSDIDQLIEHTGTVYKYMPANANNPVRLTKKWSAKRTFGSGVMANPNLKGTIAANPTEQSYFAITVHADGALTAVATVLVTIEYVAIWSELKVIGTS